MNEDYGAEYASLYAEHWWWRSRESMIVDTIRRLKLPLPTKVLDVGCGDAVSFSALSEFGSVTGIELDRALVRAGNPHATFIHHAPLGDASYHDWRFGLITALDVIEHIERDDVAVSDMAKMLLPSGYLVLTVPAFMSLWDSHDVINHHYRRYTVSQIRSLLEPYGDVLDVRYMFHGLYFLKRAVGALNRARPGAVIQHAKPRPLVNKAMQLACVAEYRALRRIPLPCGSSVIGILRSRAVV